MNHNKKRNTAFLFDILIKEQTKCILNKQNKKAKFIERIIKKFFPKDGLLTKELKIFNSLLESQVSNDVANRMVQMSREEYESLDHEKIFELQTNLIHLMNKCLGPNIFENFVPNYKNLATISMVFSKKTPILLKASLEQALIESLTKEEKKIEFIKEEVNLLHFRKFIENFNEKYSSLLDEQKELLNKFILYKFGDKVDFQLYLNEECKRIIDSLDRNKEKMKDEPYIYENINKCLDNLKKSDFNLGNDLFIESLLKYQQLAKEIESNEE